MALGGPGNVALSTFRLVAFTFPALVFAFFPISFRFFWAGSVLLDGFGVDGWPSKSTCSGVKSFHVMVCQSSFRAFGSTRSEN